MRSTSATTSMRTASAPTQGWRRVTMRLLTLPTRTLRPCSSAPTRLPPTLRRIPSRGCASSTCRIRRAARCDARRSSTAPRPAMHSCCPATRRRALRVTEWGARPRRPSVACHHPYRLDRRGAAIARMDPGRSIHRRRSVIAHCRHMLPVTSRRWPARSSAGRVTCSRCDLPSVAGATTWHRHKSQTQSHLGSIVPRRGRSRAPIVI